MENQRARLLPSPTEDLLGRRVNAARSLSSGRSESGKRQPTRVRPSVGSEARPRERMNERRRPLRGTGLTTSQRVPLSGALQGEKTNTALCPLREKESRRMLRSVTINRVGKMNAALSLLKETDPILSQRVVTQRVLRSAAIAVLPEEKMSVALSRLRGIDHFSSRRVPHSAAIAAPPEETVGLTSVELYPSSAGRGHPNRTTMSRPLTPRPSRVWRGSTDSRRDRRLASLSPTSSL